MTLPSLTHAGPNGERLGWIPDLPDFRDQRYKPSLRRLPSTVRLDQSDFMPDPYDQGPLGSCTGNAIAGAIQFNLRQQGLSDFVPSRLFIYWNERVMEHTQNEDSGAYIRDGIKSVARLGVCPETSWRYDPGAFAQKPPDAAFTEALGTRASAYQRVDRRHVRHAIAAEDPVVIGFSVYDSFFGITADGVMPMPGPSEHLQGGHAVLIVGYDTLDDVPHFRVRNSWGPGWGDGGYFWMPEKIITQRSMSSDFWVVTAVN